MRLLDTEIGHSHFLLYNLNTPLSPETELFIRAPPADAHAHLNNTELFRVPGNLNLGIQPSLLQPAGLLSNSVLRPESEVYAHISSHDYDLYNITSQPSAGCVGAPSFYPISNVLIGTATSMIPAFSIRPNGAYTTCTTAPQWIAINRVAQNDQEFQRYILPNGNIKYNKYINKKALLPRKPLKSCSECKATETPQWRRGPNGRVSLCNACGIRYDKRRKEVEALAEKSKISGVV